MASEAPLTTIREQILPCPIAYFTVEYMHAVVIANASITTAHGPQRSTITSR